MSILLPVRDAALTLAECLGSLRGQTLEDHEVVAVDDGSRDGSADLLHAAAAADARVRVVRPSGRGGLVAALNAGLVAARAPLVARMDADDRCAPTRLALQAEAFDRDPGLAVLAARVRAVGDTVGPGMLAYVEWSNGLLDDAAIRRDLLVESPLVHPSVMMRTEALRALGGYRDDGGPEDYDLWLRAAQGGLRFSKLGDILLEWRDSPRRLTRTDARYAPARFFARKHQALLAGPLLARGPVVIWGAGEIGKAWSRALRESGVPVRAFVEVDPRKLGQRIHDVPVVEPAAAVAMGEPLHLAAVGQRGARERIRAFAHARGLPDERLVALA